jgi:peptidoglycan L-alanyl-D-glutamate endopeptidase CwlK
MFQFSKDSINKLNEIHPDLKKVIMRALEISKMDFHVREGLRTAKQQKIYFDKGVSKTLHSRHLTGHAVDLNPVIEGHQILDSKIPAVYFDMITNAVKKAAEELHIPIIWGGDFPELYGTKFSDKYHFELDKKAYP